MARLLLTVADAFELTTGLTVVVPDVDLGKGHSHRMRVELRRPDGSLETVDGVASIPFVDGPNVTRRPMHTFQFKVPKARIPPGTEIWTTEE
jgi:hypothetical protein